MKPFADPATEESAAPVAYAVSRYKESRHWAIHDQNGALVCVAVYKKGAAEVTRRLNAAAKEPDS